MNKSVYEFLTYKAYLKYKTDNKLGHWGLKGKLAQHIGCQGTYLSQVLKGTAELSLEQAFLASDFFGHTEEEKKYFILLHQKDRAGNKDLKKFFSK